MSNLSRFPVTGTRPARYVVLAEHTLGYIYDEQPHLMGVLAGSVIRGGYNWMNGPISINLRFDELRPATQEDFDFFRVSSKGHLNKPATTVKNFYGYQCRACREIIESPQDLGDHYSSSGPLCSCDFFAETYSVKEKVWTEFRRV